MRSPMPATSRDPLQPTMYQSPSPDPSAAGGPFGWWLRLSAPPEDPDDASLPLPVRERLRRSRLASAIIPGIFIVGLLLLATTTDQTSSLIAVVAVLVTCVGATALNRAGQTTAAGYLLVLVLVAAVVAVFLSAPGGVAGLDYFPVYDLLIIPLVVASAVLPRQQIWLIAVVNTGFVVVDAVLQRHPGVNLSSADGQSLVAKPIVLQVVVAIVAYLWARSMDRALRRADRAEEFAALEHDVAEQRRQLEIGVQELLATHVRAANGDFSARAPMNQGSALWQVSASLNNLLGRLQKTGQSDFQLKRTEQEIDRLAEALLQARAGRRPIWPAPTGTQVDRLLEVLLGAQRQPVAPPTGQFSAQMGQSSAPRLPGNAGGQPGWENPWQSAPPQGGGAAPFDIDGGGQWGGNGPLRGFGEE